MKIQTNVALTTVIVVFILPVIAIQQTFAIVDESCDDVICLIRSHFNDEMCKLGALNFCTPRMSSSEISDILQSPSSN